MANLIDFGDPQPNSQNSPCASNKLFGVIKRECFAIEVAGMDDGVGETLQPGILIQIIPDYRGDQCHFKIRNFTNWLDKYKTVIYKCKKDDFIVVTGELWPHLFALKNDEERVKLVQNVYNKEFDLDMVKLGSEIRIRGPPGTTEKYYEFRVVYNGVVKEIGTGYYIGLQLKSDAVSLTSDLKCLSGYYRFGSTTGIVVPLDWIMLNLYKEEYYYEPPIIPLNKVSSDFEKMIIETAAEAQENISGNVQGNLPIIEQQKKTNQTGVLPKIRYSAPNCVTDTSLTRAINVQPMKSFETRATSKEGDQLLVLEEIIKKVNYWLKNTENNYVLTTPTIVQPIKTIENGDMSKQRHQSPEGPKTEFNNNAVIETETMKIENLFGLNKMKLNGGSKNVENNYVRTSPTTEIGIMPRQHHQPPENPSFTTSNYVAEIELINNADGAIRNVEIIKCDLCTMTVEIGHGIILRECLHSFCTRCISAHVKRNSKFSAIRCPYKKNYDCKFDLQDAEIKDLGGEIIYNEILENRLKEYVGTDPNAMRCPNMKCGYVWVNIPREHQSYGRCPECNAGWCFICQSAHEPDERHGSKSEKTTLINKIMSNIFETNPPEPTVACAKCHKRNISGTEYFTLENCNHTICKTCILPMIKSQTSGSRHALCIVCNIHLNDKELAKIIEQQKKTNQTGVLPKIRYSAPNCVTDTSLTRAINVQPMKSFETRATSKEGDQLLVLEEIMKKANYGSKNTENNYVLTTPTIFQPIETIENGDMSKQRHQSPEGPKTEFNNNAVIETETMKIENLFGLNKMKLNGGSKNVENNYVRTSPTTEIGIMPRQHHQPPENPSFTTSNYVAEIELINNADGAIRNVEIIKCDLCTMTVEIGHGIILRECLHSFCTRCITAHVKRNSKFSAIRCPYKKNYDCKFDLQDAEIKDLGGEIIYNEILENRLKEYVGTDPNAMRCPNMKCGYVWVNIPREHQSYGRCPECNAGWCFICQSAHEPDERHGSKSEKTTLINKIMSNIFETNPPEPTVACAKCHKRNISGTEYFTLENCNHTICKTCILPMIKSQTSGSRHALCIVCNIHLNDKELAKIIEQQKKTNQTGVLPKIRYSAPNCVTDTSLTRAINVQPMKSFETRATSKEGDQLLVLEEIMKKANYGSKNTENNYVLTTPTIFQPIETIENGDMSKQRHQSPEGPKTEFNNNAVIETETMKIENLFGLNKMKLNGGSKNVENNYVRTSPTTEIGIMPRQHHQPPENPSFTTSNYVAEIELINNADGAIRNVEIIKCDLCTMTVEIGHGIILRECLHSFCTRCITAHVKRNSKFSAIRCPYKKNYDCKFDLQDAEIKDLGGEIIYNEILENRLKEYVGTDPNAMRCPNMKCGYVWVNIPREHQSYGRCPECNAGWCFICQSAHEPDERHGSKSEKTTLINKIMSNIFETNPPEPTVACAKCHKRNISGTEYFTLENCNHTICKTCILPMIKSQTSGSRHALCIVCNIHLNDKELAKIIEQQKKTNQTGVLPKIRYSAPNCVTDTSLTRAINVQPMKSFETRATSKEGDQLLVLEEIMKKANYGSKNTENNYVLTTPTIFQPIETIENGDMSKQRHQSPEGPKTEFNNNAVIETETMKIENLFGLNKMKLNGGSKNVENNYVRTSLTTEIGIMPRQHHQPPENPSFTTSNYVAEIELINNADGAIRNVEIIKCDLCTMTVEIGHGIILRECLHSFCTRCISAHVKRNSKFSAIRCPYKKNYDCKFDLQDAEIKDLGGEIIYNEILENRLKEYVGTDPNAMRCPNMKCGYVWVNIPREHQSYGRCPECNAGWCFIYQSAHEPDERHGSKSEKTTLINKIMSNIFETNPPEPTVACAKCHKRNISGTEYFTLENCNHTICKTCILPMIKSQTSGSRHALCIVCNIHLNDKELAKIIEQQKKTNQTGVLPKIRYSAPNCVTDTSLTRAINVQPMKSFETRATSKEGDQLLVLEDIIKKVNYWLKNNENNYVLTTPTIVQPIKTIENGDMSKQRHQSPEGPKTEFNNNAVIETETMKIENLFGLNKMKLNGGSKNVENIYVRTSPTTEIGIMPRQHHQPPENPSFTTSNYVAEIELINNADGAIRNVEIIKCDLCTMTVEIGHGIILRECLHSFCTRCISAHVKRNSKFSAIRCPYKKNYDCKFDLQDAEIKDLGGEIIYNEILENRLKEYVGTDPNAMRCPNMKCGYVWVNIPREHQSYGRCPECNAGWCFICQSAHEPDERHGSKSEKTTLINKIMSNIFETNPPEPTVACAKCHKRNISGTEYFTLENCNHTICKTCILPMIKSQTSGSRHALCIVCNIHLNDKELAKIIEQQKKTNQTGVLPKIRYSAPNCVTDTSLTRAINVQPKKANYGSKNTENNYVLTTPTIFQPIETIENGDMSKQRHQSPEGPKTEFNNNAVIETETMKIENLFGLNKMKLNGGSKNVENNYVRTSPTTEIGIMPRQHHQPPENPSFTISNYVAEIELINNADGAIRNVEIIKCDLCTMTVEIGHGIILRECLHSFCTRCISTHVKRNSNYSAIRCPYKKIYECKFDLQDAEIKDLGGEIIYNEILENRLKEYVGTDPNAMRCPNMKCGYVWVNIPREHQSYGRCPECNAGWCFICQSAHEPDERHGSKSEKTTLINTTLINKIMSKIFETNPPEPTVACAKCHKRNISGTEYFTLENCNHTICKTCILPMIKSQTSGSRHAHCIVCNIYLNDKELAKIAGLEVLNLFLGNRKIQNDNAVLQEMCKCGQSVSNCSVELTCAHKFCRTYIAGLVQEQFSSSHHAACPRCLKEIDKSQLNRLVPGLIKEEIVETCKMCTNKVDVNLAKCKHGFCHKCVLVMITKQVYDPSEKNVTCSSCHAHLTDGEISKYGGDEIFVQYQSKFEVHKLIPESVSPTKMCVCRPPNVNCRFTLKCGHTFCRTFIASIVENQLNSKRSAVCPTCDLEIDKIKIGHLDLGQIKNGVVTKCQNCSNQAAVRLTNCQHEFCVKCTHNIITRQVFDPKKQFVTCTSCDKNVTDREISAYGSEELFARYKTKFEATPKPVDHITLTEKPFECTMCDKQIPIKGGIILAGCSHWFCIECCKEFIDRQLSIPKQPVCSLCVKELAQYEIEALIGKPTQIPPNDNSTLVECLKCEQKFDERLIQKFSKCANLICLKCAKATFLEQIRIEATPSCLVIIL